MRRWITRTAIGVASIVAAAAIGVLALAWSSLPTVGGTVDIAGLEQPVEITRDAFGIPHIQAQSPRDAYLAIGYVHAQDRLWQLEMSRRAGQGRLAEILGASALPIDRFMRTLGLYRQAEASIAHLDATVRGYLEAYAAGINTFLEQRSAPLPPEFQILWHEPEPWRIADSLVWPKLMALDLSKNWRDEALRAQLLEIIDAKRLDDLFPNQPPSSPSTLGSAWQEAAAPLQRVLALSAGNDQPGLGSNVWAIGGARSKSGQAMLANDPHLGLRMPSVWYLVDVQAPGLEVAGATMPSMPMVVIGRNHDIAWGFTNSGADVEDLFIETIDPHDAQRYMTPAGSTPFDSRIETIGIRGSEPEQLVVRETSHGPLISDVSDRLPIGEGQAIALRWTALEPDDRTIEAGFALALAKDWHAFREAITLFQSPPQNVAYADRQGRVGLALAGRIPIRKSGDGRLPVIGSTGAFDWTGFIAAEALPAHLDPPEHRVINANNRIVDASYPLLLTHDWDPALRARRLDALLAPDGLDLAAMKRAQDDVRSTLADDFFPLFEAAVATAEVEGLAPAIQLWNRRMDATRPEPLIFARWYLELVEAVFVDELGERFAAYRGIRSDAMRHVVESAPQWCDDVTTATIAETCADRASLALGRAMAALRADWGADWRGWRWGEAAPVRLAHQPFDRLPVLRQLFSLQTVKGGDHSTPNVAHYRSDAPFTITAAASMRMIVDWADPLVLHVVNSTGQSGHPLSPHRGDMTRLWAEGGYVEMRLGAAVAAASGPPFDADWGAKRLLLRPASPH